MKSRSRRAGVTLVETLLALAISSMLGLAALSLWDSASRVNKSEIEIADAQENLRFGLHQISRAVRVAGTGGLPVSQATVLRPDPGLPGVAASGDGDYDNVMNGSVTDLSGRSVPVRPGTDVLEVRGVLFSPLLGLDAGSCGCSGAEELRVPAVTAGGHVNDDPARRPRFSAIDAYTAGVSAARPVFVLAAAGNDLSPGCSDGSSGVPRVAPRPSYRVGLLAEPTALAAAGTLGTVDFSNRLARELSTANPGDSPPAAPEPALSNPRRAGILDDLLFFVDDTDPVHPTLARAVRRGARFDVVPLAEDVEDLQVAYGVDGLYGADAIPADGSVGRLVAATLADPDASVSTEMDGDEWVPNVEGERPFVAADLTSPEGCPALSAVLITLVAKSRNPDPGFRGRGARGLHALNSPGEAWKYPGSPSGGYRRRIQTAMVGLRNFGAAR